EKGAGQGETLKLALPPIRSSNSFHRPHPALARPNSLRFARRSRVKALSNALAPFKRARRGLSRAPGRVEHHNRRLAATRAVGFGRIAAPRPVRPDGVTARSSPPAGLYEECQRFGPTHCG